MQCYTELVAPSAVTHAVALPLVHPQASNLVVAKTSLLQVFHLHQSDHGRVRLELIAEYPLSGTVTALARVKLIESKSGGDSLLLAAKDAKLTLIDWDPENHRLSAISIHFYEGENVIAPPFGPTLAECCHTLTVDPRSRCAALKFAERQLAILPFRQSGDDLADREDDLATVDRTVLPPKQNAQQTATGATPEKRYQSSFVLPLTALDPTLNNTLDLAFLYGYREPTFGILAAPIAPSSNLLAERKDVLTYTVCTLDLEQRASTNLITVTKLPSSLWKVIPLPNPLGGALLIGLNELIHVDESGKPNATAVNEFAKLESDFGMVDQSHLNLKLEDCAVQVLDFQTRELLLVLNDASLAVITFQMQGKTISSLYVTRVASENGGQAIEAAPSCSVKLANDRFFVGSEDGASSLISWQPPPTALGRKRSHAQMISQTKDDEDEDAIEVDDDDLYDAAPETKKRAISTTVMAAEASPESYAFTLEERLTSIGPINSICMGRSNSTRKDKLTLLAATGREPASRLAILNRDIVPQVTHERVFPNAKSAWYILARHADNPLDLHNYAFIFDGGNTTVYEASSAQSDEVDYQQIDAAEFEADGETVEMHALAKGSCIVQCRKTEIRTYDSNLGLNQIIPMVDEETDAEFGIVHTSFCDRYMLVIRDDSSVQMLHVQGKEIEPLDAEGAITEKKWLSGCVYAGVLTNSESAVFLLDANGHMQVFSLPDLKPIYAIASFPHLSPVVWPDAPQRRGGAKEALTELLVADIGQGDITKPHIVLRTALDDLALYEPFHYPQKSSSTESLWHSNLRLRKLPSTYIPQYNEDIADELASRPPALKRIQLGEFQAVTIPGAPPSLLLRESTNWPRILEVRSSQPSNKVSSLSPLNRSNSEGAFTTLEADGKLSECRLPALTEFGIGWSVRQINLGQEVRHIAFHEERGVFVVATCRNVDFYFADDDVRHQEQDNISMRPQVPQYTIHLVSTSSCSIIHSLEMPYLETITDMQVLRLEISENTHEQRSRIVAGSALLRGEDMPAKGVVTVFDIIDVVPDPGVPESGIKLQIVSREETKGDITALAGFQGGLIGLAQGQKIMIRGLKEDGSCLPVAFLDATSYVHTLKTLPGTGMWISGDCVKGLWFGGFIEEPYKLVVLGRTRTNVEVLSADLLPFEGGLFVVLGDANGYLHVLQYDPENPKTVGGRRLVERGSFHVGHTVGGMLRIPSTVYAKTIDQTNGDIDSHNETQQLYQLLTYSPTGALGLITPLNEGTYRLLSSLQTSLIPVLEDAAALNPKAYRMGSEVSKKIGFDGGGGSRSVVDGTFVHRIQELGATRRADLLGRAGGDAWTLRGALAGVSGGSLTML